MLSCMIQQSKTSKIDCEVLQKNLCIVPPDATVVSVAPGVVGKIDQVKIMDAPADFS